MPVNPSLANILRSLNVILMTRHYILCLCFFIIGAHSFAQPATNAQHSDVIVEDKFVPYMVDHIYKGCPTNSVCNQKNGKILENFATALKSPAKNHLATLEKFRLAHGIPLDIWSLPKASETKNEEIVRWDSPCRQHNQEGNKIEIGFIFAPDFKSKVLELESQGLIALRRAYLETPKETKTYIIPRGDPPIFIRNEKLNFTLDLDGAYYAFEISSDGNLQITTPKKPRHYPQKVSCPSTLIERFKKDKVPNDLYLDHYCQAIWDEGLERFQTLLLGWSCH
jgi:hypothetical protein